MFSSKQIPRRQIGAALLLLTLAHTSCCRREIPPSRPLDFIPPSADVIAVLSYADFVKNELLRRVFNVSQLEESLARIGIQSDSIINIAGFVQINPSVLISPRQERSNERAAEFGVIVQGRNGFHPLFETLSEHGWGREEYDGRSFWAAQEENLAAASLGGDMMVAGTSDAVRQVIDVARGRVAPATRPASASRCGAILRRMGIRGEINIAISFSREMKMAAEELARSAGIFRGMVGANVLEGLFKVLGAGRGIGLSFAWAREGIASRVIFVASNPASAKLVAGLVAVAKFLAPGMDDFGATEAAELARGVNVSSENDLVLIDFRIPKRLLTNVLR